MNVPHICYILRSEFGSKWDSGVAVDSEDSAWTTPRPNLWGPYLELRRVAIFHRLVYF
jgi:hypothetical protein